MTHIEYLKRVVDVLEFHALHYELMEDLSLQRHQLTGDAMYQDHAKTCLDYVEQLTEYARYIQEVIDNPQLLIKQ